MRRQPCYPPPSCPRLSHGSGAVFKHKYPSKALGRRRSAHSGPSPSSAVPREVALPIPCPKRSTRSLPPRASLLGSFAPRLPGACLGWPALPFWSGKDPASRRWQHVAHVCQVLAARALGPLLPNWNHTVECRACFSFIGSFVERLREACTSRTAARCGR